jgi:ABC-type polysaccharide/polyol phosphate export permease
VIFQAVVMLLVSHYYFGLDVFSNISSLMIGIILISTIFIEIGMILGYTFKTPHISILSSTFFALALFLFSDIITPSEAMSPLVSLAVRMNPLVFSESLFRKIFFMGMPVFSDTVNLIKIGIFIAVLTVGVYFAHKINKKRM